MQETIEDRPDRFDPVLMTNAIKGLSEVIEYFVCEGPGCDREMSPGAHASLSGLVHVQQRLATELYLYVNALAEAGIQLPDPPDAVRERRALYRVK